MWMNAVMELTSVIKNATTPLVHTSAPVGAVID